MGQNGHLSRIETQWNVVRKAHAEEDGAEVARIQLIEQYGPAAKRYLLGALRNQDAAEEVFQEFALRLIRGDLKNADMSKGRFRNLVKTTLYHLIVDYHRKNQRNQKKTAIANVDELAAVELESDADDPFLIAWRESLLEQAWSRLDQLEQETGRAYFTVLRTRVDHPRLTTRQLRDRLKGMLKEVPTEAALRVLLCRARRRFAHLLLEQVSRSFENPTDEQVEEELIELGLHHYCKVGLRDS